ncbi:MAG: hypothetical protein HY349_03915 [Nitrospirae bacterium]|nr:hypothetical protein [Nitrospirota bacterium]
MLIKRASFQAVMVAGILFVAIMSASVLAAPAANAQEQAKVFKTEFSLMDNLKMSVGQFVYVRLSSGDELGGEVKEVGINSVHLSELRGREFFDALVPIDRIVAIIKRARGG